MRIRTVSRSVTRLKLYILTVILSISACDGANSPLTSSDAEYHRTPLKDAEFVAQLPVVDLHNDRSFFISGRGIPFADCTGMHICATTLQAGDRYFFSIWRPPAPLIYVGRPWNLSAEQVSQLKSETHFAYVLRAIAEIERQTERRATRDPDSITNPDFKALFLGIEGAYLIDNRPLDNYSDAPEENQLESMLLELKHRGVGYVAPVWSNPNPFGGVSGSSRGLTASGRTLVRLLLKHGFLIDLSHASDQLVRDVHALAGDEYPLFFSHSSVRSICNHPRNLDDRTLELVRQTDGMVGLNFYSPYINCEKGATKADILAHLKYLRDRFGISIIGFGSDFDAYARMPAGMNGPGDLRNLAGELLQSGFSRTEVEAIYFRNLQRVLRKIKPISPNQR
ncbi:MAG: membrane dipeptidase [Leptospiraceae bacterium]|nr:membrane dipeptidase [Leptospiraceae bacterium]